MPGAAVPNREKGNPPSSQMACISTGKHQPEQSTGRHQQTSQRPEALEIGGEVEKHARQAVPGRNPRYVDKT